METERTWQSWPDVRTQLGKTMAESRDQIYPGMTETVAVAVAVAVEPE